MTLSGVQDDAPLLQVEDLVVVPSGANTAGLTLLDHVTFTIRAGERVALVGESGSGKSLIALAISGLLGYRRTRMRAGQIRLLDRSLVERSDRSTPGSLTFASARGKHIGLITQEALSAFNGLRTVGDQITETLNLHCPGLSARDARDRVLEMLDSVGLSEPDRVFASLPHQLSGGMRQRALIAMMLIPSPELLIADEATTALDAEVQTQIADLIRELSVRRGLAVLMITHDLPLASSLCDRMMVMYAGRVVEDGTVEELLDRPRMPYTGGLLASSPALEGAGVRRLPAIAGVPALASKRPSGCAYHPRCSRSDGELCPERVPILRPIDDGRRVVACHHPLADGAVVALDRGVESIVGERTHVSSGQPILQFDAVVREFSSGLGGRRPRKVALDGVSLGVHSGESLGIVGASGSGKSTIVRCAAALLAPNDGVVTFEGRDLGSLNRKGLKAVRGRIQVVFQDSSTSLDPRLKIFSILREALIVNKRWHDSSRSSHTDSIVKVLEEVGLSADVLSSRPPQLSGGERQRIAIARALLVEPTLLLLDEPVSALDVSLRAGLLNLLADIRERRVLSLVFVSHDLASVRFLCDRILVMRNGKVVETGATDDVIRFPQDGYTRQLIAASPRLRVKPR